MKFYLRFLFHIAFVNIEIVRLFFHLFTKFYLYVFYSVKGATLIWKVQSRGHCNCKIPSFYLRHLMYLIKLNRKKYTHTIVDVYMVMHDQTEDFDFAIFFPLAIQHILVSIYSWMNQVSQIKYNHVCVLFHKSSSLVSLTLLHLQCSKVSNRIHRLCQSWKCKKYFCYSRACSQGE